MLLFCLPGIYLALTGLGAGGGKPSSQSVAANVNAILYGIFFITGWFSGTTMNLIGPNYTVFLGSIGYSLYTGGLFLFLSPQTGSCALTLRISRWTMVL
jgi:hypothetical protein